MKASVEVSVEVTFVEASVEAIPRMLLRNTSVEVTSTEASMKRWKLPWKLSRASTKTADIAGGPPHVHHATSP